MWFKKIAAVPPWADCKPFKTLTRAELRWLAPRLQERTLAVVPPALFWGWLYHRRRNLVGPALSHLVIGGYVFFILGS